MIKTATKENHLMTGLRKIMLDLFLDKEDVEVENKLLDVVNRIDVQMKKLSAHGKIDVHIKP